MNLEINTASGDSIMAMQSIAVGHSYLIVQDRTKSADPQLADLSLPEMVQLRDWLTRAIDYAK